MFAHWYNFICDIICTHNDEILLAGRRMNIDSYVIMVKFCEF